MSVDPTPAQIASLDPRMQPRAIQMVNALRSVGVPAIITNLGGRRTSAEQRRLLGSGRGVTTTLRSRHIPGMAFDLDVWGMNRDAVPAWWWPIIGKYGEDALGLRWGGRWRSPYDPGHFEL